MDPNTCCSRQTCPKNQMRPDDEGGSSQKSSAADYSDKQTQKATDLSSDVATSDKNDPPLAESAATSETHFDRNNENLSTPQQPSCPTNTPQLNQTYAHLYPPTANYPSIATYHHGQTLRCEQCPCMNEPIPSREQNNSSFQHRTGTSNSSSSTSSEHFPLRVILKSKYVTNTTPTPYSSPCYVTRPHRLQPCSTEDQKCVTPKTPTATEDDNYFSCCSEPSVIDPGELHPQHPRQIKNQDRNLAVLQLLHQAIHLISEGTSTRNNAKLCHPSNENGKSSSLPSSLHQNVSSTPESCATCGDLKIGNVISRSPSGEQEATLPKIKDKLKLCGPCSELRTLLDLEKHKTCDSDQCPGPEPKLTLSIGEQRTQTMSNITNEEDCKCSKDESAPRDGTDQHFAPPLPPWPCYCYYMAAWASAQGFAMPRPLTPGLCPVSTAFNTGGAAQYSEPTACGESRRASQEYEPKDEELNCSCSKIFEDVCPKHGRIKEMTNEQYAPNEMTIDIEANQDNESKPKTESDFVDEELFPQILGKAPSDQNPDYITTYGDEEPHGLKPIDTADIDEEQTPTVDDDGSQKALMNQAFANFQDNMFKSSTYPGGMSGKDEEDFINNIWQGFNEDCELEKEKRAERQKSRSHKDPCNCCHCQEKRSNKDNKCTILATTQQVAPGVEEFKYFIDSIIMDLDAMEHARRKCAILKNVCRPKPGVCSRESFPVTIIDVQDLGATSLYIKWTIHDCCGIAGYEIFVDGYLTNRYYHSRHEAAVVTDVDITIPHKVALVAQPCTMQDDSLDMLGNTSKCKSLLWKTEGVKYRTASLWTPSIYLYDPAQSKALPALPILNNNM